MPRTDRYEHDILASYEAGQFNADVKNPGNARLPGPRLQLNN